MEFEAKLLQKKSFDLPLIQIRLLPSRNRTEKSTSNFIAVVNRTEPNWQSWGKEIIFI
jgi:hypothetical protein